MNNYISSCLLLTLQWIIIVLFPGAQKLGGHTRFVAPQVFWETWKRDWGMGKDSFALERLQM